VTKTELHNILLKGESETVEFKSSFNAEVIETLVAFANTKGGSVCIGVSDNAEMLGVSVGKESVVQWMNEIKTKTSPLLIPDVEIIHEKNKEFVIFTITEYPIKPVSFRGKYYKRIVNANHLLSTSEVVNLHLQTFNTSWDYHVDNQHSIDDISLDKVQATIDVMNQNGNRIVDDPFTFLMKNELVREGNITHAAFLMFTKADTVLTTIELGRFQTDIIIKDSDRTKADILTQIELIIDFVKKHINKEIIITGEAHNTQKWQYPMEAIREIVMNMIVHRDYRSSSDSIVKIFDNKIEFYNPGRLPENITVEDLLANSYKSTPRNKLIADVCKSMGLIEKYGSGIRRIVGYFNSENLPMPKFCNISDGFMVTVFSGNSNNVTDNVTDRTVLIIEIIKENNKITTNEIAEKLKVTKRTILRDIEILKKQGKLKRVGNEKTGYWELVNRMKP
jgi:ATP-dependent DNA helicase RecG